MPPVSVTMQASTFLPEALGLAPPPPPPPLFLAGALPQPAAQRARLTVAKAPISRIPRLACTSHPFIRHRPCAMLASGALARRETAARRPRRRPHRGVIQVGWRPVTAP